MSLTSELMSVGIQAQAALQLGLDPPQTGVSAAGNSQATATALTADCAVVSTVSASQGVIIPNRPGFGAVANTSGTNLAVYPPVGSNFNGGTTNAALTLLAGKTLIYFSAGLTNFAVMGT